MRNYKRNSQGRFVKGTPQPNGFKKGCTSANKGKRYKCSQYNLSEEGRKQKIKNLYKNGVSPLLGKPHSKEWNRKIGLSNKGKTMTEDSKKKISSTLKKNGFSPPEKCWFKKGHVPANFNNYSSFEPYEKKFNVKLKEQIRQRDGYRCQECFREQSELRTKNNRRYKLHVHHIDYNKKNSNPENLISLCFSCHMQTNFKRNDWTKYYKNKIKVSNNG